MKISIDKNVLLEKITLASRFFSEKTSSSQILQGVLLKGEKESLDFYSSNLSSFFHTRIKINLSKKIELLIEPRKILEFLGLLPAGKIDVEISDKKIMISQQKTKGTFALLSAKDFPFPPQIKGKEQKMGTKNFKKNLSKILFSAAKDESRPVLSGVNFINNDDLTIVSTDGFRLSLIKTEKQTENPPMIIPASFLEEVSKTIDKEEKIGIVLLKDEKTVVFRLGENEFFSRLIEGEFPPFEKVIPEKSTTQVVVDKEEFNRAIKLAAIFTRDSSNVIILDLNKDGISIRPKTSQEENIIPVEAKTTGEEQTVAFNYKFLLDFLNHCEEKNIIIEILRPDAPSVFKPEGKKDYIHIIMPVRVQEKEED